MNTKIIGVIISAIGVMIVLSSSAYVVDETQQVIITQFGDPIGEAVDDPGIHFKAPFIQEANYFDKRFLEWDGVANQVPTRDKRFIWVDTYARWRISDPLLFFQSLRDERTAQNRLGQILDGETRILGPGDLLLAPAGVQHTITNRSDKPARVLAIYPTTTPERIFV